MPRLMMSGQVGNYRIGYTPKSANPVMWHANHMTLHILRKVLYSSHWYSTAQSRQVSLDIV